MLVNFTKMHSIGNDFVILDLITQNLRLHSAHLKRISHRHLGIGCDQIIVIEPPFNPDADFFYRIFNQDGSEAEQCLNGARAAARYFFDSGLTNKIELQGESLAGPIAMHLEANGQVTLELPAPTFLANTTLDYQGKKFEFYNVSIGNPHAITFVSDVNNLNIHKLSRALLKTNLYPHGVNASFVEVLDNHTVRARVYERGCGETWACGSAAVALGASAIYQHKTQSPLTIKFRYGHIQVEWQPNAAKILSTGLTKTVFIGQFRL